MALKTYMYVWEFHVRTESIAEFERHYGVGGTWAALFRQAQGYIETLLLKDRSKPGRYLTIDRWESEDAYRDFRVKFSRQYEELDKQCEGLTVLETSLGMFRE